MLIVIGGDSYYKDEDEEDQFVISRWARRKVASQFNEEYLDGRKSFIFSWDTKHRPIHEEALRHFLDPSKKGVKFVYTPKPKPLPRPVEPEFIPPARQDVRQEVSLLLCYILSVKPLPRVVKPLSNLPASDVEDYYPVKIQVLFQLLESLFNPIAKP